MGDPLIDFGFLTEGELNVGAQQVTLIAHNGARLGRHTTIQGGTLSTAEIRLNSGGTFAWNSGTLHIGSYRGNLTTPNDGTLAPGNSVGHTDIDGNYFQQSRGTLEIESRGRVSGHRDI